MASARSVAAAVASAARQRNWNALVKIALQCFMVILHLPMTRSRWASLFSYTMEDFGARPLSDRAVLWLVGQVGGYAALMQRRWLFATAVTGTKLISTRLPNAWATRMSVPIVTLRGAFSRSEIFGALISAIAASLVWLNLPFLRKRAIWTPS